MRRKVLIAATLMAALLAVATIHAVGAPRRCFTEHGPTTCDVGVCTACRGSTASGMHQLCGWCAKRQGRCEHCGGILEGGLGRVAARLFGGR